METRHGKKNTGSTKNARSSNRRSSDHKGLEAISPVKQIQSSKENDSSPPPSTRRSARIKDQNQSSHKKSKSREKSPNQQNKAGQRGRSQAKEQQRGSSAKKTTQTKSPVSQRQSSNKKKDTTPTKKSRSNSPISANKSTKNRKNKRKASNISPANKSQSKSPKSVGQTRRKSELKKTKITEQQQARENEEEIQITLPKKRGSTTVRAEDQDEEVDSQQLSKKRVSGLKKKMNTEEVARVNVAHRRVFDLNIQIKGEKFTIFRNVYVTEKMELTKLARIITTSMGWLGIWDWTFKINNNIILCPPDDDSTRGLTTPTRRYGDEVKLDSFNLKVGDKFEFIYNTKAPWTHEIVIEDLEIIDVPENGNIQDPEKSKRAQHAVVSIGNMTVPPDTMTKQDFDQVWEDYENGEKEFSKWKRKFGETFDPTKFEKNKINDLLEIYLYDESKLDPKVKEADLFFKW